MPNAERIKLSAAEVRKVAPPDRHDRYVYDTIVPQLAVRAASTGGKSYIVYRRVCGKPRKVRLASVDDVTVDEARQAARLSAGLLDDGYQPKHARRIALLMLPMVRDERRGQDEARRVAALMVEQEEGGAQPEEARRLALTINEQVANGSTLDEAKKSVACGPTLNEVFAQYMEQHAKPKKKSWRDDKRLYEKNIRDRIGHLPMDALDKEQVQKVHSEVGERAPVQANRTLAVLSKVFTFARGRNAPNPCRDIERFREQERSRRLWSHEIARFVAALDQYERETADDTGADLLRTLLLSGQRRGNVMTMRWRDLDLKERAWTIPGEYFKNGQPHVARLSENLATLLMRRKARYAAKSEYVFPGRNLDDEGNPRGYRADPYGAWKRVLEIAEIDPKGIRLHDLRRTFGSLLADNGETLEVIARQLGHKTLATTKKYMEVGTETVQSAVDRAAGDLLPQQKSKSA